MQDERSSFHSLRNNSEEAESPRMSRQQLRNPQDHSTSLRHAQLMQDSAYRSSFSFRDRIANYMSSCFRKAGSDGSFVDEIEIAEREGNRPIEGKLATTLETTILQLKISQTSRLKLDPNVMHPFVRVHIVNRDTGCYLRSPSSDQPIIYEQQFLAAYNPVSKTFEKCQNDLILPFATTCCSFRDLGSSKGVWNEKFYINCKASYILTPATVILFELLDFNQEALLYRNADDLYSRENFYRVAWGFYRPLGVSGLNLGLQQLQLYHYKFNDSAIRPSSHVPSVYFDFIWPSHEKYQGCLTVQLNYVEKPQHRFIDQGALCPKHIFQEERLDRKYLDRFLTQESRKIIENIENKPKINPKMLKYSRYRDSCEIPSKSIMKLESDQLGCFRVLFLGDYLYAACSDNRRSLVKVYALQDGSQKMSLKGHRGIIYSMVASTDQKILATVGSDKYLRLWAPLPQLFTELIDEEESQKYLRAEGLHTGAVYAVCMIHAKLEDSVIVLTCCQDGYVRLWMGQRLCSGDPRYQLNPIKKVNINNYEESSVAVTPTACCVVSNSFFVVGDSQGFIRLFDYSNDRFTMRSILRHEDLAGDFVASIKSLSQNHLVVHSSDNMVRHLEITGTKVRVVQVYAGAACQRLLLESAVSPDNKMLLAVSESGSPYLWDILTGSPIDIGEIGISIKGPLVSACWHSRYNLVAMAGFVPNCPVFVIGSVLSDAEAKIAAAKIQK